MSKKWLSLICTVLIFCLLMLGLLSCDAPSSLNWPEDLSIIKDQIIITGQTDDVDQVLREANLSNFVKESMLLTDRKLTIRLIDLKGGDLITSIKKLADATKKMASGLLSIDLNTVIGDPNAVGAHPFGSITQPTDYASFLSQWAFKSPLGIGLVCNNKYLASKISNDKVRVVIFDTSPFPASNSYTIPVNMPDVSRKMELEVISNTVRTPPLLINVSSVSTDISSHGLFVSGLVYAVAPSSDIRLVRVLNDKGQGTLYGLLKAMSKEINKARTSDKKTVFNFSFSTAPPVVKLSLTKLEKQLEKLRIRKWWEDDDIKLRTQFWTDHPHIYSLESLVKIADNLGIIIVAASGNDSSDDKRQDPEYLASYASVISVGASNNKGHYACFSNKANVAAPGGDARENNTCTITSEILKKCSSKECLSGVASVIQDTHGSYQFAYWNGTSFSTPLVSGLAALGFSQGYTKAEIVQRIKGNNPLSRSTINPRIVTLQSILQSNEIACPP